MYTSSPGCGAVHSTAQLAGVDATNRTNCRPSAGACKFLCIRACMRPLLVRLRLWLARLLYQDRMLLGVSCLQTRGGEIIAKLIREGLAAQSREADRRRQVAARDQCAPTVALALDSVTATCGRAAGRKARALSSREIILVLEPRVPWWTTSPRRICRPSHFGLMMSHDCQSCRTFRT